MIKPESINQSRQNFPRHPISSWYHQFHVRSSYVAVCSAVTSLPASQAAIIFLLLLLLLLLFLLSSHSSPESPGSPGSPGSPYPWFLYAAHSREQRTKPTNSVRYFVCSPEYVLDRRI